MKTKYLLEIYLGHLSDDYMLSYEAPTAGACAVPKAQPFSSGLTVHGLPKAQPFSSGLTVHGQSGPSPGEGAWLPRALHLAPEMVCPNWELPLPHTDGRADTR